MTKNNMIDRFYTILRSGAKNSTIARTLNDENYGLVTYAWEKYRNGVHWDYSGDNPEPVRNIDWHVVSVDVLEFDYSGCRHMNAFDARTVRELIYRESHGGLGIDFE